MNHPHNCVHPQTVLQDWVANLSFMQQTVLLTGIRGPDGMPKYGSVKMLLRWYRRCVLISALDGCVLGDPFDTRGGSFTGPSLDEGFDPGSSISWYAGMDLHLDDYLKVQDAMPFHFQMHFMHASEILGYKHPDPNVAYWWRDRVYKRLVSSMHVHPETINEMDRRLGDDKKQWLERADTATLT